MSAQKTERVVIVGGGVAGWMTASYLKAVLGDDVAVTLVASGETAAPQDDEASLGDLGRFFDVLGLAEEDWMPACDATYKLAVRFQDFSRPRHHFYLPFEQTREADGFPLTEWWLRIGPSGRFDRDCFVAAWLCDAGRSPRDSYGLLPGHGAAAMSYGYHIEAEALTRLLTGYAVDRGVRHLSDEVLDVALDARGWIDHVLTAEHGAVHGDLFVDCTGTRGLLLRRALKVPFVSYQDTLPGDSVVTLRVPADMKAHGIPPYTAITARAAGWIWSIPLVSRIGTGYVYGREYCTPEEAERALREFAGPEAAGAEAVHTGLSSGRSLRAWKHNCVAVGAAAGRVEPLEATGISFVHHALERLVRLVRRFWGAVSDPGPGEDYNAAVAQELDAAREFLTLHYQGAARDDTQFWRDAQTCPLPGALVERIERWRVPPPDAQDRPPNPQGLPPHAYTSILLGTGAIALRPRAALALVDDHAARQEFAAVKETARSLVEALPTQYDYFSRLRA
ncbi:tryptophan 7-halogenase (plasmid) [Streptomyces sp. NBC_01136]|uniref:FAD-dependent oxidoreductase n=1 Tax=unclassified Streptomyces TaxID=2593676 RepID=UPI002F91A58A|nr:tryptophan 7-halogenase [Streptomyces sp. NBC_01136]